MRAVVEKKRKGARGGPPLLFFPREDSKGPSARPSRTLACPSPRATLRSVALRATKIRRVSSSFGNTLHDCESIVRSHPRFGLTRERCDETFTVPPRRKQGSPETSILTLGIRRDPAHPWVKFCPFRWPGTKSRRYIDDFFLRTRERMRRAASGKSRCGKQRRKRVGMLREARLYNPRCLRIGLLC